MLKKKIETSVIIPTLNEEEEIDRLLFDLSKQKYKKFEVVIVDGGSKDNTKRVARKYRKRLNIRFIFEKKKGVGRARNIGANNAIGKYLLFLDSDVSIGPRFLKIGISEFRMRRLGVATTKVDAMSDYVIDKMMHKFGNAAMVAAAPISPIAPGFCIFSTKELFDITNGFDESIKFAEDVDFVERASRNAKFGMLKHLRIGVSVRRIEAEGRMKFMLKYLFAGAHYILFGNIKKPIFSYGFGKHKKIKKRKKI